MHGNFVPKNFTVTHFTLLHFTSLKYLILLLSEGQAGEAGNLRTEQCCSGYRGSTGRKSTSTLRDLRFPSCWSWGFRSSELLRWVTDYWLLTFRKDVPPSSSEVHSKRSTESAMLLLSMTNNKCCILNFYHFVRIQRFVNYTTVRLSKCSCQQKGVPFGF